ncbi:MAG: pentapeptide repeat-containing protein, partial [Nocardioides sp.]
GLGAGVVVSAEGASKVLEEGVLGLVWDGLSRAGVAGGGLLVSAVEWQRIALAFQMAFSPGNLVAGQKSLVDGGVESLSVQVGTVDGRVLQVVAQVQAKMHRGRATAVRGMGDATWAMGSIYRRIRLRQETRRVGVSGDGGVQGPAGSVSDADGFGLAGPDASAGFGYAGRGFAVEGVGEGPWVGANQTASVSGPVVRSRVPVTYVMSVSVDEVAGLASPGRGAGLGEPVSVRVSGELPGALSVYTPEGFTGLVEGGPVEGGPVEGGPVVRRVESVLAAHEWPLVVQRVGVVKRLVWRVLRDAGVPNPRVVTDRALGYIGEQLDAEPVRTRLAAMVRPGGGVRVPVHDDLGEFLGMVHVQFGLQADEPRTLVSGPDGVLMALGDSQQSGRVVDTTVADVRVTERRESLRGGADVVDADGEGVVGGRLEHQATGLGVQQRGVHQYLETHADRAVSAAAAAVDLEVRHLPVVVSFRPTRVQRLGGLSAVRRELVVPRAVTVGVPRPGHPFRRLQEVPVLAAPVARGAGHGSSDEQRRLVRTVLSGTPLGSWAMPGGVLGESLWRAVDDLLRHNGMRYVVEGHSGTKMREVVVDGLVPLIPQMLSGGVDLQLPVQPRMHGTLRPVLRLTATPGVPVVLPGVVLGAGEVSVRRVNERVDRVMPGFFDLTGKITQDTGTVRSPGALTGGVSVGGSYRGDRAVLGARFQGAAPLVLQQSNVGFAGDHRVYDVPLSVTATLVYEVHDTLALLPGQLVPKRLPQLPRLPGVFGGVSRLLGGGDSRVASMVYRAAVPVAFDGYEFGVPRVTQPPVGSGVVSPMVPLPGVLHRGEIAAHSLDLSAMGEARHAIVAALSNTSTGVGRAISSTPGALSAAHTLLSLPVITGQFDRLMVGEQVGGLVGTAAPGRDITVSYTAQIGNPRFITQTDGAIDNLSIWFDTTSHSTFAAAEAGHGGSINVDQGNVLPTELILKGNGVLGSGGSYTARKATVLDPGTQGADLRVRTNTGPVVLVEFDLLLNTHATVTNTHTRTPAPADTHTTHTLIENVGILALTPAAADHLNIPTPTTHTDTYLGPDNSDPGIAESIGNPTSDSVRAAASRDLDAEIWDLVEWVAAAATAKDAPRLLVGVGQPAANKYPGGEGVTISRRGFLLDPADDIAGEVSLMREHLRAVITDHGVDLLVITVQDLDTGAVVAAHFPPPVSYHPEFTIHPAARPGGDDGFSDQWYVRGDKRWAGIQGVLGVQGSTSKDGNLQYTWSDWGPQALVDHRLDRDSDVYRVVHLAKDYSLARRHAVVTLIVGAPTVVSPQRATDLGRAGTIRADSNYLYEPELAGLGTIGPEYVAGWFGGPDSQPILYLNPNFAHGLDQPGRERMTAAMRRAVTEIEEQTGRDISLSSAYFPRSWAGFADQHAATDYGHTLAESVGDQLPAIAEASLTDEQRRVLAAYEANGLNLAATAPALEMTPLGLLAVLGRIAAAVGLRRVAELRQRIAAETGVAVQAHPGWSWRKRRLYEAIANDWLIGQGALPERELEALTAWAASQGNRGFSASVLGIQPADFDTLLAGAADRFDFPESADGPSRVDQLTAHVSQIAAPKHIPKVEVGATTNLADPIASSAAVPRRDSNDQVAANRPDATDMDVEEREALARTLFEVAPFAGVKPRDRRALTAYAAHGFTDANAAAALGPKSASFTSRLTRIVASISDKYPSELRRVMVEALGGRLPIRADVTWPTAKRTAFEAIAAAMMRVPGWAMSDRQLEVLAMWATSGYSFDDAAPGLGVKPSAVRVTASTAANLGGFTGTDKLDQLADWLRSVPGLHDEGEHPAPADSSTVNSSAGTSRNTVNDGQPSKDESSIVRHVRRAREAFAADPSLADLPAETLQWLAMWSLTYAFSGSHIFHQEASDQKLDAVTRERMAPAIAATGVSGPKELAKYLERVLLAAGVSTVEYAEDSVSAVADPPVLHEEESPRQQSEVSLDTEADTYLGPTAGDRSKAETVGDGGRLWSVVAPFPRNMLCLVGEADRAAAEGDVYEDRVGGKWLFTAQETSVSLMKVAVSRVAARVGVRVPETYVFQAEEGGPTGTIERLVDSEEAWVGGFAPGSLAGPEIVQIWRYLVVSWLFDDFTGLPSNFRRTPGGQLFRIGFGGGVSTWFQSSLPRVLDPSGSLSPFRARLDLYGRVMREVSRRPDVDLAALREVVDTTVSMIQNIADSDLRRLVRPALIAKVYGGARVGGPGVSSGWLPSALDAQARVNRQLVEQGLPPRYAVGIDTQSARLLYETILQNPSVTSDNSALARLDPDFLIDAMLARKAALAHDFAALFESLHAARAAFTAANGIDFAVPRDTVPVGSDVASWVALLNERVGGGLYGPTLVFDSALLSELEWLDLGTAALVREGLAQAWSDTEGPGLHVVFEGVVAGGVDVSGVQIPLSATTRRDPWGVVQAVLQALVTGFDTGELVLVVDERLLELTARSTYRGVARPDTWPMFEAVRGLWGRFTDLQVVYRNVVDVPGVDLTGAVMRPRGQVTGALPRTTPRDPWGLVPAVLGWLLERDGAARAVRVSEELMAWAGRYATTPDLRSVLYGLRWPTEWADSGFELVFDDGVLVAGVDVSGARAPAEWLLGGNDVWGAVRAVVARSTVAEGPGPARVVLTDEVVDWLRWSTGSYDLIRAVEDLRPEYPAGLVVEHGGEVVDEVALAALLRPVSHSVVANAPVEGEDDIRNPGFAESVGDGGGIDAPTADSLVIVDALTDELIASASSLLNRMLPEGAGWPNLAEVLAGATATMVADQAGVVWGIAWAGRVDARWEPRIFGDPNVVGIESVLRENLLRRLGPLAPDAQEAFDDALVASWRLAAILVRMIDYPFLGVNEWNTRKIAELVKPWRDQAVGTASWVDDVDEWASSVTADTLDILIHNEGGVPGLTLSFRGTFSSDLFPAAVRDEMMALGIEKFDLSGIHVQLDQMKINDWTEDPWQLAVGFYYRELETVAVGPGLDREVGLSRERAERLPESWWNALRAFRLDGGTVTLNMVGENWSDAELAFSELSNTDLSGKVLVRANLIGANLIAVNLQDANLRGAFLAHANLSDANLIRAVLVDANLDHTELAGASLSGSIVRDDSLVDGGSHAESVGDGSQRLSAGSHWSPESDGLVAVTLMNDPFDPAGDVPVGHVDQDMILALVDFFTRKFSSLSAHAVWAHVNSFTAAGGVVVVLLDESTRLHGFLGGIGTVKGVGLVESMGDLGMWAPNVWLDDSFGAFVTDPTEWLSAQLAAAVDAREPGATLLDDSRWHGGPDFEVGFRHAHPGRAHLDSPGAFPDGRSPSASPFAPFGRGIAAPGFADADLSGLRWPGHDSWGLAGFAGVDLIRADLPPTNWLNEGADQQRRDAAGAPA